MRQESANTWVVVYAVWVGVLDPIEPHGVCLRTLPVQLTRAPQPFQDPYSNASVRKAVLDLVGEVPGLNTAAQVGVL